MFVPFGVSQEKIKIAMCVYPLISNEILHFIRLKRTLRIRHFTYAVCCIYSCVQKSHLVCMFVSVTLYVCVCVWLYVRVLYGVQCKLKNINKQIFYLFGQSKRSFVRNPKDHHTVCTV